MSASRCTWLAACIAFASLGAATLDATSATAEDAHALTRLAEVQPQGGQPAATAGVPDLKPTFAPATFDSNCATADALGVSRVVEIDTSAGPRFGEQYHKDEARFLEPGEVVLTFDDGPVRRYTMPILEALDEQCVKATFFSVGRMAISDPTTLREVAHRGHTIGVHTWSHKNLATLGADAMKREFELGLSSVAAAVGAPIAPFFRFPYLGHSRSSLAYVQSRGVGIFGIHVDSKDFRTKSPGVVLRNVMTQLAHTKKGILLFHDIQPSTAGAVSSLLAELKAGGYKIVHMVPKDTAVTLPEYDAIAAKALGAKAVAAAGSPIANRAATWPVSGATPDAAANTEAAPAAAPRGTTKPPAAPRSAKPYDWANPSNDPWQLKTFGDQ